MWANIKCGINFCNYGNWKPLHGEKEITVSTGTNNLARLFLTPIRPSTLSEEVQKQLVSPISTIPSSNLTQKTPKRKRISSGIEGDRNKAKPLTGAIQLPKITNFFGQTCHCKRENNRVVFTCLKCIQVRDQSSVNNNSGTPPTNMSMCDGVMRSQSEPTKGSKHLLTPSNIEDKLKETFEKHIKEAENGQQDSISIQTDETKVSQDSDTPNPAVMSVSTVVKLFNLLKTDIMESLNWKT